jgi:hypothetical protein
MADAICRWRNGTPKTVVELVNSIPHTKMPIDVFRSFMENRWDGDFFRTPYQLACQLGLYCEAEDGYYYPRFDHDIDEKEAEDYLLFWLPKYYVPNPYTRKDGFQDIDCPTYFLKELYEYARKNPNCTYKDAYEYCFHETAKNNDDIIRNYINSYSRILSFSRDGLLNVTNVNPNIVFKNMDRNDKKAFFDNFDNEIVFVRKTQESLQQIYYGAPGTGKSHEIKRLTKGKEVIRTTFHPDSDYSTFVGAYKPTTKKVPIYSTYGEKAVEVKDADGNPMTEDRIVYEFVEQAFLQAYIKAWKQFAKADVGKAAEEVYLIIEEINRGNCAQIFGDLFQLLDRGEDGFSEYPIVADKDLQKQLAKAFADMPFLNAPSVCGMSAEEVAVKIRKGEILLLPNNLYIWATMNTSDQSLFPIDSAFKRRWDWQYMPIANGNRDWRISANDNEYDWWEFLEKINALIGEKTSSEDKKLGYYFCKAKDGVIDAKMFVGKVIFYLWNDVFKDYEFEGDAFNDVEGKLTFDKFYKTIDGTTSVVEEKVALFLKNLEVKIVKEDIVDDEADDVPIDGNGVSKHKSLRSVKFQDGTLFSTEEMSHFDVYLESLKKIGLERVHPIVANMKYRRKNCPMISLEEMPDIVNSNFKYHKEGDYYIVKGAIDDTLINILNELNSQLNIGYIVNYE